MEPEGSLPPVLILSQVYPLHLSHLISCRSIPISTSHLCLGLPSGLFPSGLPTKPCVCRSLLPHACHMLRRSHSFLFNHSNVWWGEQIMNILILQSPRLPCNLVPVRPKYLSQHPTLKYPQPMCHSTILSTAEIIKRDRWNNEYGAYWLGET